MNAVETYLQAEAESRGMDPRAKIILLLVYSVSIFFVTSWVGITCFAMMFVIALAASSASVRKVLGLVVPVYVIVAFTVLFNMFIYLAPGSIAGFELPQPFFEGLLVDVGRNVVSPEGIVVGPIWRVAGDVYFTLHGLERGLFFSLRILLLVWMSLVLCLTTNVTQIMGAFRSLLSPLRKLHVPVDDVAMVFSIALRFIPLVAEEYFAIRDAQWSRGASFGDGSIVMRVKAHCAILVPLLVGLFRRADTLANAMDARCYGSPGVRRSSIR